jgi:hypothetical protein
VIIPGILDEFPSSFVYYHPIFTSAISIFSHINDLLCPGGKKGGLFFFPPFMKLSRYFPAFFGALFTSFSALFAMFDVMPGTLCTALFTEVCTYPANVFCLVAAEAHELRCCVT